MKHYIVSVYKEAGKLGNSVTFSKICFSSDWIEIALWNLFRIFQYIGLYSPKISRENNNKWESYQENTEHTVFLHTLYISVRYGKNVDKRFVFH